MPSPISLPYNESVFPGKSNPGTNNAHMSTRIFIPDMLARWPWVRRVHPDCITIEKESSDWASSFHAFSPKVQDAWDRCKFSRLGTLIYPDVSKEHARAGADLMHVMFMFDESSDRSTPSEVRGQKNIMLDALRNPHIPRPEGEWVGGEMTRQFWEHTIKNTTQTSQEKFIRYMGEYLEGVVQESICKKDRRILDVKSYIEARRRTIGLKTVFCIYELGYDIPDDVMSHPAVQEMMEAIFDIASFTNDIYSYNLEQMRGDELHNIITCVMHEYHTDVNGAMLWVQAYVLRAGERFLAAMAALPDWDEPLDSQIKTYCNCMGQFVRSNDEWCLESERYLGSKGPEMRESRWMSLLPKDLESGMQMGPVRVDSSLL